MRNADLADTSLASCRPDIAGGCDSLAELACEAVADFIPEQHRAAAFAALERVLAEGFEPPGLSPEQIVTEAFRAAYADTSHEPSVRIIAAAALKRLGKDGRSYQAMGDEFGVTRACVQAHSRRIERNTGIKCRADKPDRQRRGSAEAARGRVRESRVITAGAAQKKRSLFALFRL